jgi:glycosyltransferase involved in cell wall biosynthesis
MNEELVSVIMTAFNEEDFISQTIDSYLCQSYKNTEILIVNDGSTDKTGAILDKYSLCHSNIKVIHFASNKGKASAQNAAFKKSSGKYIAITGADDYGCYSRIKSQIDYLIANKLDCVFSNLYLVDQYNCCILKRPVIYPVLPSIPKLEEIVTQGSGLPGGTMLFTRDLAQKIYPIPEHLPYEDLWFNFIASIYGAIGYIPEPLGFYRQHRNNSYGLFNQKSYVDFKKNYIRVKSRLFVYRQAMRNYMIAHKIWNDQLQLLHDYEQSALSIELSPKFQERLKKSAQFLWQFRNCLRLRHICLAISPELSILYIYIRMVNQ